MSGNSEYSAFDGQVIFITCPHLTPKVYILDEKIESAIEGWKDFKGMEKMFFDDFRGLIRRTTDIQFNLNDNSPASLHWLQSFWADVKAPGRDFSLLWERFVDGFDTEELREQWWIAVTNGIPLELAADPVLATPLPTDDQELADLPDDHPLSSPTSASKIPPSKSQKPESKPSATATP